MSDPEDQTIPSRFASTLPPKPLTPEEKLEIVIEAMHHQSQQLDLVLHGLRVVLEATAVSNKTADLLDKIDAWLQVRRHDTIPTLQRLRAL